MRRSLLGWLVASLAVVVACTDLPPVGEDVCGNGVIDPGEDCDGSGSGVGVCAPPDGPDACHYVCDQSAGSGAIACPAGYACGVDSECRLPSGQFIALAQPVPFGEDDLFAGDVDGDGFDDLVGTSQATLGVLFGSPAGVGDLDSQTIDAPDGDPAFGDLDGDGLPDLVLPSKDGLFAFLATGRSYAPFAYSSIRPQNNVVVPTPDPVEGLVVLAMADDIVSPDPLNTPLVALYDGGIQFVQPPSKAAVCYDGTRNNTGELSSCEGGAPTPTNQLVGHRIARARTGYVDVGSGPGSNLIDLPSIDDPTDEIAIGFQSGTQVSLFTPDGVDAVLDRYQTIELPAGVTLPPGGDGELLFGFFDADACVDLLIPVVDVAGGRAELAIAFGTPAALGVCPGTFQPTAAVVCPVAAVAGSDCGGGDLVAIGAADFDNDGLSDVVLQAGPTNIVLNNSTAPGTWSGIEDPLFALPRAWTEVVTGDVDHDGLPDISGIVGGDDDVDVQINAGDGVFNPGVLSTQLPVHFIETADFNGDLVDDLAIAVGIEGAANEQDHIQVSYGVAFGEPTPLADMGAFNEVISMAEASLVLSSSDLDAIADLVVVDVVSGSDEPAVAILHGSTTDVMLAPLVLQVDVFGSDGDVLTGCKGSGELVDQPAVPVAAVLGRFTTAGSGDPADVAVLAEVTPTCVSAQNGSSQLPALFYGVTAMGLGGGDLEQVADASTHQTVDPGSGFAFSDAHYVTVPLGPGSDLVVAVDGTDNARTDTTAATSQLLALATGSGSAFSPLGPPVSLPDPFDLAPDTAMRAHSLRVVDLEGSGNQSVVLELDAAVAAQGSGAPVGIGIGMIGSGSGSAGSGAGTTPAYATLVMPVDATGVSVAASSLVVLDETCHGAAPILVTPTSSLEVAMICPAEGSGSNTIILFDPQTGSAQGAGFVVPAAAQLVVGDFDGDGLDDLAVVLADSLAVQIYHQCAQEESCGSVR